MDKIEKLTQILTNVGLIVVLLIISFGAFTSIFIMHDFFLSVLSIFSIFVWIWGWKGRNY